MKNIYTKLRLQSEIKTLQRRIEMAKMGYKLEKGKYIDMEDNYPVGELIIHSLLKQNNLKNELATYE